MEGDMRERESGPANRTPAIRVDGLTKRFDDDVAVHDLDLAVRQGEAFGLLGSDGSGKSTVVAILLGHLRPSDGTATVLGYDSQTTEKALHRRVGGLSEQYSLHSELSGREHIEFAITSKRVDDDPETILDRVGLDADVAARPAGEYTGPTAKRLALGMALVGNPDLLVLDEPTIGLDPMSRRKVRDILCEEAAEGTTIFLTSDRLSVAEAVCDRIALIHEGRHITVDPIEQFRRATSLEALIASRTDRTVAQKRSHNEMAGDDPSTSRT
jgi:ABC-2 type transport system ATP-binding protein